MENSAETNGLQVFQIANITVIRGPLVKYFYWKSLDIDSFNDKVALQRSFVHDMYLPVCLFNSEPLQIVFWLHNLSEQTLELRLKRIKNCECVLYETRISFNKFRQMYHCPHRPLIHILQDFMHLNPDDLVAMRVVVRSYLLGPQKITYEIGCSDGRVITLNILLDIISFDPQKCILTRELLPIDMLENKTFVQPIWIRNLSMMNRQFGFSTRETGFKIITKNLIIPCISTWPLIVEYRPMDLKKELEITMKCATIRSQFKVIGNGTFGNVPRPLSVPVLDHECTGFQYVIFPNTIDFETEIETERSLIVTVHNYDQTCRELRWQNYSLTGLFDIAFVPQVFRLKPHHSKIFAVNLTVHKQTLKFENIPTVLEIHRILDRKTRIAQSLLTDIESIDDPKWAETSFMQHAHLTVNIQVNDKDEKKPEEPTLTLEAESELPTTTIFEKLFWQYMCERKSSRENSKISDELNYDEVLDVHAETLPIVENFTANEKNRTLRTVSKIVTNSISNIAREWRFVPNEYCTEVTAYPVVKQRRSTRI